MKLSIIIVSYNQYHHTTGPCLNSLIQDRTLENAEIIVVDNCSDSETKKNLQNAERSDSRITVIFNDENRGYAGGNNDGVKSATGDILILLNNDTIVTHGAFHCLASLLIQHPDWAMVGPMTNDCGNDQKIYTDGNTVDEILGQGALWCSHSNRFHYETDLLGFFCVAMRKRVYNQLGGLDESFGLGFYEDTDFCFRAFKKGLKMVITEDAFVYHYGSGSFSKVPSETKALLKKNKKIFRQKHGTYPTFDHVRHKNLAAMQRYDEILAETGYDKSLIYKFENRYRIARQQMPNNPLKKYFYLKKLNRLTNRKQQYVRWGHHGVKNPHSEQDP